MMAAITEPLAAVAMTDPIRPFDIRRDLTQVADLVELCFTDTLDPDGRDYLARMRSSAKNASILRAAQSWARVSMEGFVWLEEAKMVGNVSLIPYYIKNRRFFLVANVAVHPNYRRRGIARKLTEKAIQFSRERGSPSVWLHVREENQPARRLYQSLGFEEKAIRTTWLGSPDFLPLEKPVGMHLMNPGYQSWPVMNAWLKNSYPPELSWHLPFHANNLRPGPVGMVSRFLYNAYVRQWGVTQGGRLKAAAAWQASGSHANMLWLAAPIEGDEEPVRVLLTYIRHHAPTHRAMALDFPAHKYENAFREAGFNDQQTLVWMEKQFIPAK